MFVEFEILPVYSEIQREEKIHDQLVEWAEKNSKEYSDFEVSNFFNINKLRIPFTEPFEKEKTIGFYPCKIENKYLVMKEKQELYIKLEML
jgi:hypothetical protein